jgi:hypothetical protein
MNPLLPIASRELQAVVPVPARAGPFTPFLPKPSRKTFNGLGQTTLRAARAAGRFLGLIRFIELISESGPRWGPLACSRRRPPGRDLGGLKTGFAALRRFLPGRRNPALPAKTRVPNPVPRSATVREMDSLFSTLTQIESASILGLDGSSSSRIQGLNIDIKAIKYFQKGWPGMSPSERHNLSNRTPVSRFSNTCASIECSKLPSCCTVRHVP